MNISQKTDHHSNRKPPGASIAGKHNQNSSPNNKYVTPYNKYVYQNSTGFFFPFIIVLKCSYQQDQMILSPQLERPEQMPLNPSSLNNHGCRHLTCWYIKQKNLINYCTMRRKFKQKIELYKEKLLKAIFQVQIFRTDMREGLNEKTSINRKK